MAEAAERKVYEAGAGRKTFLSLAFLILLPFYASLPAMLIQRLTHGLWLDTIGLMVFALIFTGAMALLVVQLYQSLRSRVEFCAVGHRHLDRRRGQTSGYPLGLPRVGADQQVRVVAANSGGADQDRVAGGP